MLTTRLLRILIRILLFAVGSKEVHGLENIPDSGPYMVVVNHMSKADPPLLYIAFPPMQLRFFAGEKWESHILFGPIMRAIGAIYINRDAVDRRALRKANDALAEGSIFGLAPEGKRSKVGHLIRGRDGAAYLATRAPTPIPILPVGLTNTDVVGANFVRLRRTRMGVNIGQPFYLPGLGRRVKGGDLRAYTHLIMVKIAELLPPRYHGFYTDSPALAALLVGEDPWPYCLEVEGVKAVLPPPASAGDPDATQADEAPVVVD